MPVIDVVDGSKKKRTRENRRKIEQKIDQQIGLANLEKSIKSLEKHLKLLNKRQMQQTHAKPCEMCGVVSDNSLPEEKQKRLPTIIEGIDASVTVSAAAVPTAERVPGGAVKVLPHRWSVVDTDDSLLDVDLDSFLLVSEKRGKPAAAATVARKAGDGIDNPTYEPDDEDDLEEAEGIPVPASDKLFENNYKCTKYINSCPDDAYNVEGVNDYKYATPRPPAADKPMPAFLKSCGDQVHCQHTKDILKDIYEKLTLLTINPTEPTTTTTTTTSEDSNSSCGGSTSSQKRGEDAKSEDSSLKNSISTLKRDLEAYLKLVNDQDEMEIKQFCSGLSKNYKLLTMQHAMAKKARPGADNASETYCSRSYCSSGRGSGGSHAVSLYSDMSAERGRDAGRKPKRDDFRARTASIDSVRCSSGSDSNFQLHRRHSDSACSSWDEVRQTSSSSSQRDDTSQSLKSDEAAIQIEPEPVGAAGHIAPNLALQQPPEIVAADKGVLPSDEKDLMLELHRNKPSIWQQYYGSKRLKYSNVMKKFKGKVEMSPSMAYVSVSHTIYF